MHAQSRGEQVGLLQHVTVCGGVPVVAVERRVGLGWDEGGVAGRNNKGLVTMDRLTKKDSYYIYKAYWNPEPMVHLCGKRYAQRAGETREIKVYTNLDTVMLGFMTSDETVGYYNAAVRIKSILVSIVTSLGAVLLPRASYYVERGEMDRFRQITRKALNFVFLAAVPMMIYFMVFARQGIFLLSGENYAGAVRPMQWIMPTLLFIGLSNVLGIQILVPLTREKVVLWSLIAGAAVDVVLNVVLIPKYIKEE